MLRLLRLPWRFSPPHLRLYSGTSITVTVCYFSSFISSPPYVNTSEQLPQCTVPHFKSAHSYLGVTTYILIVLQFLVGFTQLFTPQLYGGEENAKKIYRFHRIFGYVVILPLLLVTAVAATYTYYVANVLQIKTWPVVLACLAIFMGVYSRIKIAKLKGHSPPVVRERED